MTCPDALTAGRPLSPLPAGGHGAPRWRLASRWAAAGLAFTAAVALADSAQARPLPGPDAPPGWQSARCGNCAVVESVAARPAETTGVGSVAGAVVGGVIGRQIGRSMGSDGHGTLGTVLGAIGGGWIGHRIEQQHRGRDAGYRVTLRMTDGSQRVVTQAEAPAVGSWVRLDGDRLVPLPGPVPQAGERDGDHPPRGQGQPGDAGRSDHRAPWPDA